MANIKNANVEAIRMADNAAGFDTPAAGYKLLYFRLGGLYFLDESDVETPIGGGLNVGTRLEGTFQAVDDVTQTVMTFSDEIWDDGDFADLGLEDQYITVPAGFDGLYMVTAQATFASHTPIAGGVVELRIDVGITTVRTITMGAESQGANGITLNFSDLIPLVEGDTVGLNLYHDAGESVDVNFFSLSVQRLTASAVTPGGGGGGQ